MKKLALIATAIFVMTALFAWQNRPHLELFPPLERPELKTALIEVALLKQDMDALYEGVMDRHPSLDTPSNRARLKEVVAQLKAEITEPMTRQAFFGIAGQLAHHLKDGHSFLIWPYQEYADLQKDERLTFPFKVQFRQGKLLLRGSYRVDEIIFKSGSWIVSINDVPSDVVIGRLQQYTGGETVLLREQMAADRFAPMLWAVYGFVDEFHLKIKDERGTHDVLVNGDALPTALEEDAPEDYSYTELEEGIGLLAIHSFDTDPGAFADFAEQSFQTIRERKIHSLIIDIRDNTGGNTDTVTTISRYLADTRFRLISHMTERINQDNRGLLGHRGKVGELIKKDWDDWEEPMSEDIRFKGDTYLLIGPITYSASIVFATTLQDNGFAEVIGQKTGGYANQTAQGHLFNLPHSQLRAYVATRLLVRPNGNQQMDGVVPDHVVKRSVHGLEPGRNPELERALALIVEKVEEAVEYHHEAFGYSAYRGQ